MRYQRKSAKIIINRQNFGHRTEIDLGNHLILLRNNGGGGGSRTQEITMITSGY